MQSDCRNYDQVKMYELMFSMKYTSHKFKTRILNFHCDGLVLKTMK